MKPFKKNILTHLKPAMSIDTEPVKVRNLFKIFICPPPFVFQKARGGTFAGWSFEQISMQGLTGVPSPTSGGTGWVGSDWAGNWRPQPINSLMPNRSEPLLSTSQPALKLTKNRSLYLVCNRLESKKPNRRGMG